MAAGWEAQPTPTPTALRSIPTGEEERCTPSLPPAASTACFLPAKISPGLPPREGVGRCRCSAGGRRAALHRSPDSPATGFAFRVLSRSVGREGRSRESLSSRISLKFVGRPRACGHDAAGWGTGWLAGAGPAGVCNRHNRNAHLHPAH